METQIWGDRNKAKVLVIGHDPRLQNTETQANYCFFADYFLKSIPGNRSELAKYKLAEALFSYISLLTSYRYRAEEYIITNLCNSFLPKQPKGKTVYISEEKAKEGIEKIRMIINQTNIELIIATSQQVNYWLQKLGFYSSTTNYIRNSEPRERGVSKNYYEPVGKSPFLEICGKKFLASRIPLFPVLHVKQFPLRGNIKKNYQPLIDNCINEIKKL